MLRESLFSQERGGQGPQVVTFSDQDFPTLFSNCQIHCADVPFFLFRVNDSDLSAVLVHCLQDALSEFFGLRRTSSESPCNCIGVSPWEDLNLTGGLLSGDFEY